MEHGLRADQWDRLRLPRLYLGQSPTFQRHACFGGHAHVNETKLPSSAKIVIVGGGIRLVDRLSSRRHGADRRAPRPAEQVDLGLDLACGGAGGQLRSSANITQLLGYSVALYDRLEAETGQATGWKRNGGLRRRLQRGLATEGETPGDARRVPSDLKCSSFR